MSRSDDKQPGPTVALIAALADEMNCVHRSLGRTDLATAVTGIGPDRARAGVTALLDRGPPAHAILFGVAGALDPGLATGAIFRPRRVVEPTGGCIDLAPDGHGVLLTLDRLAASPRDKRQLRERHGADAVDMETFHVCRLLRERNVPVTVIRAISDAADTALPPRSADWVTPDGRANTRAASRYLLRHPGQLPTLLGLRASMRRATASLADAVREALEGIG